MNKPTHPPKLPLHFFRWFCHPDYVEDIEGDLLERFENRVEEHGAFKAKSHFIKDIILLFRPGLIRPTEGHYTLNHYGMFKNYFKVGIRNILKYKTFSFINIFGLAVAMAVALLVILMLADQHEYDQFHTNKDRIYRVLTKKPDSGIPNASSPFPLASTMKRNYPIVEEATYLMPGVGGDVIYLDADKSVEMRGFFADEHFFDVFGFELTKGDKSAALSKPNTMVITSQMAYRLFNDQNPIGKTVQFSERSLKLVKIDLGNDRGSTPRDFGTFTISGIIDANRFKSHLKFDVLISSASLPRLYKENKVRDLRDNWENYSKCYTYLLLRPGSDGNELQTILDEVAQKEYAEFPNLQGLQLINQPLTEINPGRFLGNPASLRLPIEAYYFLAFLVGVVMLSAGLNYTNLSIARVLTRAKEIGVRKVNGATRKNLVLQFLTESLLTSFLALIIANLLLFALKPAFNDLWVTRQLSFDLTANLWVYLIFLGFSVLVGLMAGIYPALVLSGFSPVKALKNLGQVRPGKIGLRKALNVSQFVFSLFFIITSILIVRQFRHFIHFEYGFNTENVINIPLQGNDHKILKTELAKVPGVEDISACEFILASPAANGVSVRKPGDNEEWIKAEYISVDPSYRENMGLRLIAGQDLIEGSITENWAVVNEEMTRFLGFETPEEAIGQTFEMNVTEGSVKVIGVIENFKFQTPIMGEGKSPLILWNRPDMYSYVNVRVSSGDLQGVLGLLESKWEAVDPVHPFLFSIYDEELVKANQWLGDLASVIGFIAFLAIVISCLGLLGMAIYTSERRVKEVGIRKVLGAKITELAILLSGSFLKLLLLSILIAAPLSYFANKLWLDNIPNRVEFGFGTVLLGSLFLIILGILTIGFQVISVSKRNPVDSLKYE